MVPFKDYFLGNNKPPHTNLVSSQKCIRTVDIDIIGDTDRHLTFLKCLEILVLENILKNKL